MYIHVHVHVLMRDETDARKKQARSNKQQTTRQSNTAHPSMYMCIYMYYLASLSSVMYTVIDVSEDVYICVVMRLCWPSPGCV